MKNQYSKGLSLTNHQKRVFEKFGARLQQIMPTKKKTAKIIRKARVKIERLHNIPKIGKLTLTICNFCDLLADYFDDIYPKAPISTITTILIAIFWFVSPIDLIPDFFLFLGFTDDAAVLAAVALTTHKDISDYLDWKKTQV